jgi:hypothetical protein
MAALNVRAAFCFSECEVPRGPVKVDDPRELVISAVVGWSAASSHACRRGRGPDRAIGFKSAGTSAARAAIDQDRVDSAPTASRRRSRT